MLWIITVILFFLWLLGVAGAYPVGAWLSILLTLAVASAILKSSFVPVPPRRASLRTPR